MCVRCIYFLLVCLWVFPLKSQTGFDINRENFYKVITRENLKEIEDLLKALDKYSGQHDAHSGALRMKKSGLLTNAKDKLRFFKAGQKELETAIAGDSTNAEYRFLRLLIQENAPKIVHYNDDIKKDALYLRTHYKTLSPAVQKALLNYCSRSKELKRGDFNNPTNE